MKKVYDCFQKVIDKDLFYQAYLNSQKGKCSKKIRAIEFSLNWIVNLENLRKEVENQTYKISDYSVFKIYEPKERTVEAPHYRDKIVQYCITQVFRDIYETVFIHDSYACIRNKGNHLCIRQIENYFRKCNKLYRDGYVLKMDIKKFFPSIDHQILKDILRKRIKDERMIWILDLVIDSNNNGLNIGNSTSQIFSNIYLNEIDHYIKRKLKCRYYIRYADDLILFCYDKLSAKWYKNRIKYFLKEKLNLNIYKVQINTLKYGISMMGFHFKPTYTRFLKKNIIRTRKYDKEKDKQLRNLQLNNSLAFSMNSMTMFLFGNMEGFEYDLKKRKYIFRLK